MDMKLKQEQHNARINGIRETTSFRIEALETALQETKIKY